MRMKLKNLKKVISVTIICTMIAALFVPTLTVQAAEAQAIANVVENYTDIENSEYKINNVTNWYETVYVYYSVPESCKIIMAEYDGVTGYFKQTSTKSISASTDGSTYFYLQSYGNQCTTVKLFIVDSNYRPLGKSYTETIEVTDNNEAPSFGSSNDYGMEPHPTVPLKNDSGCYGYDSEWSVNTDGVLNVKGSYLYTNGQNIMPWNEYRDGITTINILGEYPCVTMYMFQGLSKVKEVKIPSNAYLENYGFYEMASLETVVLSEPNGEDIIYSNSTVNGLTFRDCPSLKEFVVADNDANFMTVDGVLYSKDGTRLIKYPAGKTDKSFTIPDSVETIDAYAFEWATNLESVYNVCDLSNSHTFENCTSLKNIEIASGVITVNLNSFCNCNSLTELTLPESVEDVDFYSDWQDYGYDCDDHIFAPSLESINIPANLADTSQLISVLPESIKNIEIEADDSDLKYVDGALYDSNMTTLYRCFDSIEKTSFTVPDSVTVINENAFKNCKNLKNITIGNNVENIGAYAFEGCTNLTDISLANVSVIGNEAFKNCISLKNVDLGSVTDIYEGAFDGCKSLETITVPASVTNIESGIFANCDSLKAINVAEGNLNYTTIDGCLYEGTALKEFPNAKSANYVVSSVTTQIMQSAFEGRNSLESIVIPASVEQIDSYAFSDCGNLSSVTLPEGLSNIASYTFNNCTSLSKINFPGSLTYIESFAFVNCKSLKALNVSETNRNGSLFFYERAFYNCGLESITVTDYISFSYIPFYSCFDLKTIKFEGDAYYWWYATSQIFWNVDDLTIYYPEGNKTWDSSVLHNYQHKDSLKFAAYNDGNKNYNRSYTFTGLKPNSTYIVGISDGAVEEDFVNSTTLICFDQLNSDSNGNLEVSYKVYDSTGSVVPFVLDTALYDISNASIEIGENVYSGKEQDKPDNYTVTYDGKELTEGVDYLVTNDSGFNYSGDFYFTIVGIGNYYGSVYQKYQVLGKEYDADGDGKITVRDATAIQFYCSGIRGLENYYAADANGDGSVNIDDATYIQKLLAGMIK